MKLASRPVNYFLVQISRQSLHLTLSLAALIAAFTSLNAGAKDLIGRLGVGVSNIGAKTTEAFSIDWQLTQASGVEANLGLATQSESGGWELGIRASRNLFVEDNMLFSLFVGGAVLQQKVGGVSSTGYLIETGLGSIFFLEGLPNLGFGFRGSFQMIDVGSLTLQVAPIFGMHYYF